LTSSPERSVATEQEIHTLANGRTRMLSFVQAEYFEPGPEDLNFLPLKSYEAAGQISEFPLPPSIAPSFRGLVEERDSLRRSLAKLQRKLAAAKLALE
jgi:hypothetical protein